MTPLDRLQQLGDMAAKARQQSPRNVTDQLALFDEMAEAWPLLIQAVRAANVLWGNQRSWYGAWGSVRAKDLETLRAALAPLTEEEK